MDHNIDFRENRPKNDHNIDPWSSLVLQNKWLDKKFMLETYAPDLQFIVDKERIGSIRSSLNVLTIRT
jgi:hypothetical protein